MKPVIKITGEFWAQTTEGDGNFNMFAFPSRVLDENKPSGSIRMRVETIKYFLRRYREDMIERREEEIDIETRLEALRRSLLNQEQKPWQLAMAGD